MQMLFAVTRFYNNPLYFPYRRFVNNTMASLMGTNPLILGRSKLFKYCLEEDKTKYTCHLPSYLQQLCSQFPITFMKLVRIRMALMERLLSDSDIENLHVIYLVRDPRGVMSSRWSKTRTGWCGGECLSEKVFCDDIEDDLLAARNLHKKFPGRVHVFRFEDIALSPEESSHTLLDSVGISYTKEIEEYVKSHTSTHSDKREATYRVSKTRVVSWVNDTSWANVERVEAACGRAMDLYGYSRAESKESVSAKSIVLPFTAFEDTPESGGG